MHLSGLDLAIVLIVIASFLYSLFRGLVREIFSLLAVILGFVAACRWYGLPAAFLHRWMTNAALANVSGFFITLISTVIVINLFGRLTRGVVRLIQLGAVDRFFGAIFGILKGLLIAGMVVAALVAFLSPANPTVSRSRLAPYIFHLGRLTQEMLPQGLQETIRKKKEALFSQWNRRLQNSPSPAKSSSQKRSASTPPPSSQTEGHH